MDYLSLIKQPIIQEIDDFIALFNTSLSHDEGLLQQVLEHIRQRGGKRMRPMLVLLMAKNFGKVSAVTQNAAVGLELLHTASLVHDDVVDESGVRRGQASVNASYDNKVAVLVGDYILSTALLYVSHTGSQQIVSELAQLGRELSNGEILQLTNIQREEITEEVYYEIIKRKTAVLFETCAKIGAQSVGATDRQIAAASEFGSMLGMIFQIRDDIFDYYDSSEIGKPTGNDMREGKLTLPVIYALKVAGNDHFTALARKVKQGDVTPDEIEELVKFAKDNGGIDYAEQIMRELHDKAMEFIRTEVADSSIKTALKAYLDYVIERKY